MIKWGFGGIYTKGGRMKGGLHGGVGGHKGGEKGFSLKGPKHGIFGSGFFTLIKPIWIGDLGTNTKNLKWGWFGLFITFYYPRFLL
jgi:hypothetical protein